MAAPATKPVAAAAAAWTAGSDDGAGALDRADLGEHRHAVDGLLLDLGGGQLELGGVDRGWGSWLGRTGTDLTW